MKKLLFILLVTIASYSQNVTVHFYGSSELTTGAEVLFPIRNTESMSIGGGFSGAWDVQEIVPGHINEYDLKQTITDKTNEEWCSLYVTSSFGYLNQFLIKYRTGLAVYNQKITFNDDYTKSNKIVYKPLIGIGAMYSITKDFGIEVGIDTFNKGTIGITAIF